MPIYRVQAFLVRINKYVVFKMCFVHLGPPKEKATYQYHKFPVLDSLLIGACAASRIKLLRSKMNLVPQKDKVRLDSWCCKSMVSFIKMKTRKGLGSVVSQLQFPIFFHFCLSIYISVYFPFSPLLFQYLFDVPLKVVH